MFLDLYPILNIYQYLYFLIFAVVIEIAFFTFEAVELLWNFHNNAASWENYIIQQIISHYPSEFDYSFYRTQDGSEMDLVLSRSGIPEIGIEIKYSLSPKVTKGNLIAAEDLGTKHNYIVNPQDEQYPIHEKFDVIGLKKLIEIIGKIAS